MLTALGDGPDIDVYGDFEPCSRMFVDQGWLLNETEIQLRFFKDPIHMYKVYFLPAGLRLVYKI